MPDQTPPSWTPRSVADALDRRGRLLSVLVVDITRPVLHQVARWRYRCQCWRSSGNGRGKEDLCHEILLHLLDHEGQRLRRWDPALGAGLFWYVARIADSWLHDDCRKCGRRAEKGVDGEALISQHSDDTSAASAAFSERKLELQRLLEQLEAAISPRDFECFRMIYLESIEPTEAAARLGLTMANVYKILHTVRELLKKLYRKGKP